jgi:hypothetical protein
MNKTVFLTLMLLISSLSFADTVTQTWVRTYNNPQNLEDMLFDIAADGSGNVYVAGMSNTSYSTYDITLIKYNSSGVEQWVKHYDSGLNRNDYARAIAIDLSGNIYVAGQSDLTSSVLDCRLLKYSASGVLQWAVTYHDSGNAGYHSFNDVVTDSAGNVYVTSACTISATGQDYLTIKYSSSGGSPVWVKTINSAGTTNDSAEKIALDASNNVYVAGSCGIVKYNGSTGGRLWAAEPGTYHNKMAVDASGNFYAFNNNTSSLEVFKYNSSGSKQWQSTYTPPEGSSYIIPTEIVADPFGNCIVSGVLSTSDIAAVKFSPSGELLWDSIYPTTGTSVGPPAMACDQWGNTYLSTVYNNNLMTYKNDADGEEKWDMVYAGTFTAGTQPAIFVKSGEVYVASSGTVSGQSSNFFALQYNQRFCTVLRPGDVNKDCSVDFLDFATVAQFWAECNKYPSSECN